MMNGRTYELKPPKKFIVDSFGGIAVSSLLICVISGIVLAVPFDVADPYLSISGILLSNPGAVIARNMHYWSAQSFLIFSLLHIYDHFRLRNEKRIRIGIWFRLLVSIFVIFYAMLSGFILKGDADSEQALLIFGSLIDFIPLIGKYISLVLLGNGESYLLLYVNHIALATIFIFLILFEHARIVWGRAITFFIVLLILLLLSVLFQAPLHDNLSGTIKGPWYFLGLQEVLHWMKQAGWIWFMVFLIFFPLILLPYIKDNAARIIKILVLILIFVYALLTIIAYFFRGEEWKWTWDVAGIHSIYDPIPLNGASFVSAFPQEIGNLGRSESCMLCHDAMKGFSEAHSPQAIGCVSCHLGNPFSPEKQRAHKGMLRIPGNLENASRSCGTSDCHPDISRRIGTGLMATNSGIVAVNRFVFGESDTPDGHYHIMEIGHSASDKHLRNMCARCHLSNPKTDPGPINEESRGGGCNACHLNYSTSAIAELNEYYGKETDSSLWSKHPSLDLNMGKEHCFGCHSRSGRISTSYEGWHETLYKKEEITRSDTLRILKDGRVFRYISEDIHHKAGLECIDCHDSYELMGDGTYYQHVEEQVKISCEDCHFSEMPALKYYADLDSETQKILQIKKMDSDGPFLPLGNSGRLIWNSSFSSKGDPVLIGKTDAKIHPLNPPKEICKKGSAHSDLSCQSCHTAWIPQCIGCHNEYDPKVAGYDMIENEEENGSWVEYVGLYLAGRPSLGVIGDADRRVPTFTPGMILTIDKSTYDENASQPHIFKRLYAPLSAHTTNTKGRDCRSCHNEPFAIGYGHGTLEYKTSDGKGTWIFTARFANNKNDGLPEDAWIPFLGEPEGDHSTRSNARPFNPEEQKRILLLGSCLECHNQHSDLMLSTLENFNEVIKERSVQCILPDYFQPSE